MINISVLLIYILTVIVYDSTPGPVIMLVTGTRLLHSFKHTFITIIGANLGSVTSMLVAIFAMLGLIGINYNLLNILKIVGCVYLLYLSIKSIYSVVKLWLNKGNSGNIKVHTFKGGFKQGYLVGASNPKDMIFFVSFFPQFMNVSNLQTSTLNLQANSLIIIGTIWAVLDGLILLAYALIVTKIISKTFENIFLLIANIFIFVIAIFGIKEVTSYFLS